MTDTFQNTLRILVRRRYHFLVFFACMVAIPMALAYVIPGKYKGEAIIYLRPGAYKKPFMPSEANSKMSYMEVSMEDVASEVEVIQSRPILEKAVEETGLDKEKVPTKDQGLKYYVYWAQKDVMEFLMSIGLKDRLTPKEDAIQRLFNQVEVDFVKRSNIITIEWLCSDPDLTMRVVNSIAKNYIDYHLKIHGHSDALKTVKKELENTQARLLSAETDLEKYKREQGVSDIASERTSLIAKITDTQSKLDMFQAVSSKDLESGSWSDIEGDPGFLELRKKLTDLEIQKIEALTKYGKEDQNVQAVEQAIKGIMGLMKDRLQVMMGSWRQIVKNSQERLKTLEAADRAINQRERDIRGLTALHDLNLEKYNELVIDDEMSSAEVASPRIVQEANLPEAPHFPKKWILLLVCIFLGVVGGVSYAYAYDRLAGRVTAEEEMDSFGVPVRVTLPRYGRSIRHDPFRLAEAAAWDCMPLLKCLERGESAGSKCLMLVPANPGAGASFISGPLCTLAANHFNVPVVRLAVHARRSGFGRHNTTLAKACDAEADLKKLISRDPTNTFDELIVEVPPDEAGISRSKIAGLVESLKQRYGYVIIDIGATRLSRFYFGFASYCDDLLVVVAYDRTNRSDLNRLMEIMVQNGVRPSGFIFNQRCSERPYLLGWLIARQYA